MKNEDYVLEYIDSLMIVDRNLKVLHGNRFNPRFNGATMQNEYERAINKPFFHFYNKLDPKDSTMAQCLRTGKVVVRENQSFTDLDGGVYTTKNITYPIIRYGQIVAAVELSQDITTVGDFERAGTTVYSVPEAVNMHKNRSRDRERGFGNIISCDPDMVENIRKAKVFALDDNPVLIYGETGTGKELFVVAMVQYNERRSRKFIEQSCATIPENLFESLLFGSTKGAFTGAENKKGLFELADGGVLFLDELNSMPMSMQGKLLRVLQDGRIRPIGSAEVKEVNVKVIAAMNKDPMQLIKEGMLREDLFYRLSSNTLFLTPLRERREDIQIYLDYFLEEFNRRHGKSVKELSEGLKGLFLRYRWPGNVRELKHVLESMVTLSGGETLDIESLPIYLKQTIDMEASHAEAPADGGELTGPSKTLKEALSDTETRYILRALNTTDGNVTRAAELLGMPRQTLKFRMDKLGIQYSK